MMAFNLMVFGITAVLILWLIQDPRNNTKIFLNIPSIAVLLFSMVVLGTNWSVYGPEFEAIRIFLGGIVAIPYVVAAGFAYFLRVYAYIWQISRDKMPKKHTIEDLLKSQSKR